MTRLLTISNGHGEDFIAARLGEALLERLPRLQIEAFPLVGTGRQLEQAGLQVLGPRQQLPSGGLTLHDPRLLWRDLRAGLLPLTLRQARYLRSLRPHAVLVVGDAYAQMHASLVRAPRRVLQPLVSVHHLGSASSANSSSFRRYFMERFRTPELFLLKRAQKVYARDAATAEYLRGRGVPDAAYLGNPMMDGLQAPPLWAELKPGERPAGPAVALLPGSRQQATVSVNVMLAALLELPQAHGLVAWLGDSGPSPEGGWAPDERAPDLPGLAAAWRSADGSKRVWWLQGRFAAVLASSSAAIGTAGTANEQAVGLGLPVVAFEVSPLFGRDFLENQARLLGSGLLVGRSEPNEVAARLKRALHDEELRAAVRAVGQERMGGPGASAALADDLAVWLAGLDGVGLG